MNIVRRMFDSRSKEEKERDYETYFYHIFPYGDEQKQKITGLLKELIPKEKIRYSMLHYILLKQCFFEGSGKTIDEACLTIEKKKLISLTPQVKAIMRYLLTIDISIDEKLNYPKVSDIQKQIGVAN